MVKASDRVRLQHMLDAARKAVRFADGKNKADLLSDDDPLADALVRLVSLVGEAANQVSAATRSQIETVPWADLVGMRNRLVHAYFDVNLDIFWATVRKSLPELIENLEAALSDRGLS